MLLAIVLLTGVVGGALWLRSTGTTAEVTVGTVVERTAQEAASSATVLNASGYVTARRRATVSAKITGKLVETRVEEGLPVSRGDTLARLDDKLYRASLALAESRLEAARGTVAETETRLELALLTLERTERLAADGVVGDAELDAARTEVTSLRARQNLQRKETAVAESEVALRRAELADTIVRAPFDGIVISKDAQVGEMVSPVSAGGGFTRTGICTIVDMASLEIEVDVNESFISRVRPDQPVEAVLDAYPDWRIPGRVITTIPAADRQKATVLVRIGFDELDPRILPDMGVKVAFREERVAEATDDDRPRILIPTSAARKDGGTDVVFVFDDDRVERRAVRLGTRDVDGIEVVAGLRAGERVVVDGPEDLRDGQQVRSR